MNSEKIKYICKCGASFIRPHYFKNHMNICSNNIENIENIENLKIDDEKKNINNLVIVAHPDDESIWCDEKLCENTHVIVVFGFSKLGLETAKIRSNEFINAMKIVGCSYEIWNYREKQLRINNNILNEINIRIKNEIDKYKNIKTVYTHNYYGEYGHIDHLRIHQIVKTIYNEYYNNKSFLKFYQFNPSLNYNNHDRFFNIPFQEASKKRKKLLDCYKSQTINIYKNIVTNFIELNASLI
jgi:LmbE family N-acetylglucosaminyl deacetylase